MKFPVRRLEWIAKLVSNEMISYARRDDTLDDFGYGGEIGDWPIVRKIFFVQKGFLEKGSDDGLFQLRGNSPAARLRLTMRVVMGVRTQEQCLRSDVGRASRPHCLLGRSRISLSISSSVAGGRMLKSGVVPGGLEDNDRGARGGLVDSVRRSCEIFSLKNVAN